MGPGCFYPGNDVLHGGNSDGIEASMGPGCFYPGNLLHQTGMYQLPMLQWGRDVSIPEICFIKLGCISFQCFNGAGMFLSRKFASSNWDVSASNASMGPGCFYPGNCAGPVPGDALSGASMGPGCFYPGNSPSPEGITALPGSFNGAGMFLSRKSGSLVRRHRRHGASMGPGCFYPGNHLL